MTFKSTKITKTGKGKFKVKGDLTLHGVTKPTVFMVEGPSKAIKNPWGKMVRAVSASGKIKRKDFGLTWNKSLDAGGVVIGDVVDITVDIELLN